MERSAKVAIPLTAVTVVVPERGPPAGFAPRAGGTGFAALGTVLPKASTMRRVTGGLISAPATAFVGCWTKSTSAAEPAATVIEALPFREGAAVSAAVSVWPPAVFRVAVKEWVPPSAATKG